MHLLLFFGVRVVEVLQVSLEVVSPVSSVLIFFKLLWDLRPCRDFGVSAEGPVFPAGALQKPVCLLSFSFFPPVSLQVYLKGSFGEVLLGASGSFEKAVFFA